MVDAQLAAKTEFKETEIGPIPAGWDDRRLLEVLEEARNTDPRRMPDELFRYIDVSSVSNELNKIVGYQILLGKDAPSRARKHVSAGDTLFATVRPYLRNIAQVPKELDSSVCSTGYCVLRANPRLLAADYLFFAVLSDGFVDRIVQHQRGSSYPAVSDKIVKNERIPLPPLPEQQGIATVLNAIQDAIAAQEDVIAEARALKRSLMQRLFTYGPGREPAETKETEIGEIPAHWKTTPLRELCVNIVDCPHTTPNFKKSGVLTVRNFNIRDGQLQLQDSYYTSEKEYLERIRRLEPQAGDVLFSREAPIGEACLIPHGQRLSLGQRTMLFRPDPGKLNGQFLVYAFYSAGVQNLMQALGKGVTAKHLNVGDVRTMSVPVAPMHEQDAIATMVSALDSKIAVEEDRKVALQDLFRSALHQLMTGQIRLLSDEGEPRQPTI